MNEISPFLHQCYIFCRILHTFLHKYCMAIIRMLYIYFNTIYKKLSVEIHNKIQEK